MVTRIRGALCAVVALALGCSSTLEGGPARPATAAQREVAQPEVAALRAGSFDLAARLAGEQVAADGANPYPRLVRAIARYKKAMTQLVRDGRTVVIGGFADGNLNGKYLRTTFGDAEVELAAVEADLAVAARRSGLSLELCLACWDIDWNGDGHVDERDRRLLEIEQDETGEPIPEGDPRRRPTFRFDDGDVPWARAFVSFERAALDVVLAYDWTALAVDVRGRGERADRIVIPLVEPQRIAQAKQRILEGIAHSDAARRAYLAETDDDREWVPSPRQHSHPMPLPVDQALYDTWEGVLGDARRLVQGDQGLSMGDLLELLGEPTHPAPRGYLDVARLLDRPRDLVIDRLAFDALERAHDTEGSMRLVLGDAYRTEMTPSPLPGRLLRMRSEVDRRDERWERKLRYLFWLN